MFYVPAGKTNVAMLTVTSHFRDVGLMGKAESRGMDTGDKVVYIAPMKALAQEVVEKFSSKLKPLGLIVRELTGDMQLTKAEAQSANVIVSCLLLSSPIILQIILSTDHFLLNHV